MTLAQLAYSLPLIRGKRHWWIVVLLSGVLNPLLRVECGALFGAPVLPWLVYATVVMLHVNGALRTRLLRKERDLRLGYRTAPDRSALSGWSWPRWAIAGPAANVRHRPLPESLLSPDRDDGDLPRATSGPAKSRTSPPFARPGSSAPPSPSPCRSCCGTNPGPGCYRLSPLRLLASSARLRHQHLRTLRRVEQFEVFLPLAHADQFHRQAHFLRYGHTRRPSRSRRAWSARRRSGRSLL